jgi:enoyl-CoA hydratase/carnithine racemase
MVEANAEILLIEQDGPILILTLNRPERLNAYVGAMGTAIADAVNRAGQDDSIRAIILTGAGRAFCAGADISSGADAFGGEAAKTFGAIEDPQKDGAMVEAMWNSTKPIIAAINGPAVGVGATLPLSADIRIASDSARFGFVFARVGLVIEAAGAWFLPRIVGMPQAMRWCYSGAIIGAAEALAAGLVSEVVPAEELLPRAWAIALEIAGETSSVAIAAMRQLFLRSAGDRDPFRVLQIDARLNRRLGEGADVAEGVQAILDKRTPRFTGQVSTDMPDGYPWWQGDGWTEKVYK